MVSKGRKTESECILRSPGLRPRHWTFICESLPGRISANLVVIFPDRFNSLNEEDEEEWDVLDQEEVEAMKEISSASKVRRLDEVSLADYPRFVVKNFHLVPEGTRVEHLLKVLLPLSRIVYSKQQSDKETARLASELREREESMKKKQIEIDNDSIRFEF
jgi:hypothetical protein